MRNRSLVFIPLLVLILSCVITGHVTTAPALADAGCYNAGLPVPTPGATGQITFPVCINGVLQSSAVCTGCTLTVATPLPVLGSINSTGPAASIQCDFNFPVSITSTGGHYFQIVAASGTKNVYVCGYALQTLSGTAPTFKFASGTHTTTDCDTSEADLSGVFGSSTGQIFMWPSAGYPAFISPAGQTLCLFVNGAAATITGFIKYTIF
jgi:hypothetical protein